LFEAQKANKPETRPRTGSKGKQINNKMLRRNLKMPCGGLEQLRDRTATETGEKPSSASTADFCF